MYNLHSHVPYSKQLYWNIHLYAGDSFGGGLKHMFY